MASVIQLLDTFTGIIDQLVQLDADKRNNVVIGGSCALHLMGVQLDREPEDLDIIVYEPTTSQLKFVGLFDLVYQRRNRMIEVGSLVTIKDPKGVGALGRLGRCGVVEAFNPLVTGEVLVRWGRQEKGTIDVSALDIATKQDYTNHLTFFDNYKLDCDDVYFEDDGHDTDTLAIWEYKRKNGNKINFIIKDASTPNLPLRALLQSVSVRRSLPIQSFNTIFEAKLAYGRAKDVADIDRVIKLNLTRNA